MPCPRAFAGSLGADQAQADDAGNHRGDALQPATTNLVVGRRPAPTVDRSAVGGLADRRRPFGLLRLTGVPVSLLRRVVALEAAVPLLLGCAVAAGAGFLSAGLFLRAQTEYSLQAPGARYWLLVGGGVMASLAIVASTLPLLARTTGAAAVRND